MVKIEIIDASYPKPARYDLMVDHAITVGEALAHSPFNWQNRTIGVYGRIVSLDTLLEQDSRIEMYEALWIDPKQARRVRASHHKKALTSPLP